MVQQDVTMTAPQFDSWRSMFRPTRVLVDASYTLTSGRHSGIERVVRNLRYGFEQRATAMNGIMHTTISSKGHFYQVDSETQQALDRVFQQQADIVSSLPKIYSRVLRPVLDRLGSQKLKDWFLPEAGHMGLFKVPHRYYYKHCVRRSCRASNCLQLGAGDLLLLPDAYWARKEVWAAAQAARQNGSFVAAIVYDLIPITHPQFVGQRRMARFVAYLKQLVTHTDFILAISDTVRRELVEALPGLMGDTPYCQNISSFPLGAEFRASTGQPRAEVLELFQEHGENNPYLTVAAFDPRKNHAYLLDAFEQFWKTHPHRKLCLVGRVGSRCEDVVHRIRNHPRFGKELIAFHDLNDVEVQYCYQHSRGVIFPSIVEGFGLPIVEALWHGQRTLASDTPIHREVGGKLCKYFDLSSPDELCKLLVDCDSQPHVRIEFDQKTRPYTWSESVDSCFDQCVNAYHRHKHPLLARTA